MPHRRNALNISNFSAFGLINSIVVVCSAGGEILYANPKAAESIGPGVAELEGFYFQDICHPRHRKECAMMFSRMIEGELSDFTVSALNNRGGEVIFDMFFSRAESGGHVIYIGIGHDVTAKFENERIRAEAEDKLMARNTLNSIIAEISSFLIQTSPEGIEDAVNNALKMLGEYAGVDRTYIFRFSPDLSTMSNTYEWCREGVKPQKEMLQTLAAEMIPWWMEQMKEGKDIYVPSVAEMPPEAMMEKSLLEIQSVLSLLVIPMYLGEQLIGFIGFDAVCSKWELDEGSIELLRIAGNILSGTITRKEYECGLMEAKNKAECAERIKTAFLENVSHELRTPLNSMLGFAEILKNDIDDDTLVGYADNIISSGKGLLAVLNDIIEMSKIETGQVEIKKQPVNLRELIDDIESVFSLTTKKKGLNLSVSVDGNMPGVLLLDRTCLRRALYHIVGNAVKFTECGGVAVRVKLFGDAAPGRKISLAFEVEDTGIGISEENKTVIFEAFRQREECFTKRVSGMGIGLTIALRLARLMNGDIYLKSEKGMGSTFTLLLRGVGVSSGDLTDDFILDYTPRHMNFKSAKVLIVDESEEGRREIVELIAPYGPDVMESPGGKEALKFMESVRPDIIFVDFQMKEMEYGELCREIKNSEELAGIPLIVLYPNEADLNDAAEAGLFDGYLLRPADGNKLLEMLVKHLPFVEVPEESTKMERKKIFSDAVSGEISERFGSKFARIASDFSFEEIIEFAMMLKAYSIERHENQLGKLCDGIVEEAGKENVTGTMEMLESLNPVFE